jgi:hypothetical protein
MAIYFSEIMGRPYNAGNVIFQLLNFDGPHFYYDCVHPFN